MRRAHLLLIAFISSGCATATEPPGAFSLDSGTAGPDTRVVEEDTGSIEEDTGSIEEDTGSTKKDSGTPIDSSSPVDSSSPIDTGIDSTMVDSSGTDIALLDTAIPMDTSVADTTPTDGGVGPTRILAGSSLVLHGVTTDNYAIVSDSTGSTSAVPLAGGAPVSIASGTSIATVSGYVVFSWGAADLNGFAPLRVWSAATGVRSVATKAIVPSSSATYYVATASKDGAYIFYTDNAVFGSSDKADIKVAKTDGTGVRTVFTQYIVYDGSLSGFSENCAPYAGWVGTRFVSTHCTPSGSVASFDASSIDPATGSATSLGTGLNAYWTADDAGTKVAVVSGGSLRVVPVTGGLGTTIDTGVASGVFTHDGASFVYRTTANVLKRSSVTAPSPLTLTSGATAILSLPSPNDQWVLYAGTGASGAYDIRRASTTTAGSTTLHATANAEVYGSGFTADSAYAIYYTNVTTIGVGNLVAYPMAGGSPITLGANAWYDFAVGGSKLVYNDDHAGTSSSGTATIRARDVGGIATTIAAGANRNFTMNGARDKVVYTMTDGLYVAPIL